MTYPLSATGFGGFHTAAKGAYFGLNIKHEQRHTIRSTIEGIMYTIYSIGKTLEEHRQINSLSANGTFASFPFWAQMMADIFDKPVHIKQGTGSDSVALGSFLLTATDIGLYKNLDEAAESVALPDSFIPYTENHRLYMKHFVIFERLIDRLRDEFDSITELQQGN